jgi:hypothetical protein
MSILKIISIILTLGTSPNCDGLGICKIEEIEIAKSKCESCIEAQLTTHEKGIAVLIPEGKIPDKVFLKYFTTDYFVIKSDIEIPKSIAVSLGYPNGYVIKKGKYQIYEDVNRIVLKL